MKNGHESLAFDPLAFESIEPVELVADWNAADQIDITLLLSQFAEASPGAVAEQVPDAAVAAPAGAGDVILLDFGVNGGLAALYDGLPAPIIDI